MRMKKQRRIWISTCIVVFLLSACSGNDNQPGKDSPTTETSSTATRIPSHEVAASDPEDPPKFPGLREIFVHRADGFTEHYADDTQFAPFTPLIVNIESLYAIAQRGGAEINESGTERIATRESESEVLEKSDEDAVDIGTSYVRLRYDPVVPEAGQNDMGHKDLIVFVDADHRDDAYLGVQNPNSPEEWTLFPMPGYGPWLTKELAIILRAGFGF